MIQVQTGRIRKQTRKHVLWCWRGDLPPARGRTDLTAATGGSVPLTRASSLGARPRSCLRGVRA